MSVFTLGDENQAQLFGVNAVVGLELLVHAEHGSKHLRMVAGVSQLIGLHHLRYRLHLLNSKIEISGKTDVLVAQDALWQNDGSAEARAQLVTLLECVPRISRDAMQVPLVLGPFQQCQT